MNSDANPILTLAWTFGVMSLFAVGGANAAIPEMHRLAVDVQHWMTDKQFADVFAISQLSPGPNVLIVTLIGYSVAGVAGALAATLAMCGPSAVLAYYVSGLLRRSSHSRWPAIIQAALVPLSIGLMAASGLILALSADRGAQVREAAQIPASSFPVVEPVATREARPFVSRIMNYRRPVAPSLMSLSTREAVAR